jgi:uncharacterized protein
MHALMSRLGGLWLVCFLPIAGLAAADRDPRLADAVERQDKAAARALLKAHADVNAAQGDGATALHWAAHWGDLETADLLLRAGANVNAANDFGVTPLSLACEDANEAMAERLLKAGANPNAASSTGETALLTAARTDSVSIVKALVARGADVSAKEASHDQTALMWAVANLHPDVVQALIEAGADINARSVVRQRVVHTGNRYGDRGNNKGVVQMDLGGFTPLLFAARQGDLASARLLIAANANVNDTAANGASALVIAAHSGHGALATLLLDKGADPNAAGAGYTALHAAVLRGDLDLIKALLAHGANPNAKLTKGTPARYYSKDYSLNEVALLGATPFWQAARYGDFEIMRTLGAAGADARVSMEDGTTAVMAAIVANGGIASGDRRERYLGPGDVAAKVEGEDERITFESVKVAVEAGADVNAANRAGDTALHSAATRGLNSVVQFLVDRGANLEAKNKREQTPLAAALVPPVRSPLFSQPADDNRKSTVELLRKLGARE